MNTANRSTWSIKCMSGAKYLVSEPGKKLNTIRIIDSKDKDKETDRITVPTIRIGAETQIELLNNLLVDLPFFIETNDQALTLSKIGNPVPADDLHEWKKSHGDRQLSARNNSWAALFFKSLIEISDNDSLLNTMHLVGAHLHGYKHYRVLRQQLNCAVYQIQKNQEKEEANHESTTQYFKNISTPVVSISELAGRGKPKP